MQRYLITGATGFVGGHVAEAAVARGLAVSAIARASSDRSLLKRLGVDVHMGDIADPDVVRQALAGADVVVHCAAKVGDTGPVEDYRAVNLYALRILLESCRGRRIKRFVHMSTLGVYEARHHYGTNEDEPLPISHIDGYTQTKFEAEQLALTYYRDHSVPVVVLRPGFVYGPRDKSVMPRLITRLKQGKVHYLGGDRRALNCIYVANLADAVLLAAESPNAVGQVYNLTDGEPVTKERFLGGVADALNLKKPHQRLPRWLAGILMRILERQVRRATAAGREPWLTPAQFKFLLLNLDFSIAKAKRELGYEPRVSFDEGLRETMAWYRQNT
jgi:nucleoside-diphosphate-sugar epimerase